MPGWGLNAFSAIHLPLESVNFQHRKKCVYFNVFQKGYNLAVTSSAISFVDGPFGNKEGAVQFAENGYVIKKIGILQTWRMFSELVT